MPFVVAAAQLIDSSRKCGDKCSIGAQVSLQPFADGVADRHACLVIDLFEIVVDSGYPWRSLTGSTSQHSQGLMEMLQDQVTTA